MNKRKTKIAVLSCVLAFIVALMIAANYLTLVTFDGVLTLFFKTTVAEIDDSQVSEEAKNLNKTYYERQYPTADTLNAAKQEVCYDVAQEGYVLLKNDDVLPLNPDNTTLSLWGWGSYNYMYIGTGTASAGGENATLREGMEHAKFTVNDALWSAYGSSTYSAKGVNGKTYKANAPGANVYGKGGTGLGSMRYGNDGEDWTIFEIPYTTIASQKVRDKAKGTIPVYTITRLGGEGCDLARSMQNWTLDNSVDRGADSAKHYLEPNSREIEMMKTLKDTYKKLVVLINSNNTMELGEVVKYADAVIWAPGGGNSGTKALGDLLAGKANFSGRLVDTYAYDAFSSPAMQNFGEVKYEDTVYYTLAYKESIYVGYRYYETRYEDSVLNRHNAKSADVYNTDGFDYSKQVQYPFGYGMSYSTFKWSDFKYDAKTNTVEVTVTNDSDKAGADVVELYYQSEYTDYDKQHGIEKSSVNLLGAKKTGILAKKGDFEKVTFKINPEDLRTYDSDGAKTYILDAGTYYFTTAKDSHDAVNNILAKKGVTTVGGNAGMVGSIAYKTGDADLSKDPVTDTKITNQFDYESGYIKQYLSRKDWSGTYPTPLGVQKEGDKYKSVWSERNGLIYVVDLDPEIKTQIESRDTHNPDQFSSNPSFKHEIVDGTGTSEVELIDMRGRSYDDDLWEEVLNKVTIANMKDTIPQGGWGTPAISQINKPKTMASDGPTGLNDTVGLGLNSDVTLPAPCLLAATFNRDLAIRYGKIVGEDSLRVASNKGNEDGTVIGYSCDGWYAPSMNLHRTPFGGRNFEYYSEDPVLSGIIASGVINGAAQKGMVSMMKHFAMNENETERKKNGLVTWAGEQSIRELYLTPFEMALKKSGTVETKYYEVDEQGNFVRDEQGNITMKTAETPACLGVMSSFVRIGPTWTGGNYNLLTNILRKEWGFKGYVITDTFMEAYMSPKQIIYAGGDIALKKYGLGSELSISNETDYAYAREAMKHVLYATANCSAMNGFVHGTALAEGFAYYKLMVIAFDVVFGGLAILCIFFITKNAIALHRSNVALAEISADDA